MMTSIGNLLSRFNENGSPTEQSRAFDGFEREYNGRGEMKPRRTQRTQRE